jgi:hypothetical protein
MHLNAVAGRLENELLVIVHFAALTQCVVLRFHDVCVLIHRQLLPQKIVDMGEVFSNFTRLEKREKVLAPKYEIL